MIARFTSLLVFGLALAPAAHASTLPRPDFGTQPVLGLGGGQAIGLAFDVPIDDRIALGAAIGSRAWVGAKAEARGLYRFWQAGREPVTLCWVLGAQAAGPAFSTLTEIEPVVGLAAAYPIGHGWIVRGVLAAGLLGYDRLRPAGLEVAYRFHPRMEGTIGFNGNGDVAGLKIDI